MIKNTLSLIETGEVLPHGETAEYWAEVINADLADSVQAVIAAGHHLIEAKKKLKHGEWDRMTGQGQPDNQGLLNCHYSTAAMLMKVARHERISNVEYVQHLPSSWGTLYELTKLTPAQWDYGLSQGIIRPDMERNPSPRHPRRG